MESKNCNHQLIPFEFAFAKITYPDGYKNPPTYDYSVSIFNASVAHVKRFLCVHCGTVIKAPNIYDCADNEICIGDSK